MRDSSFTSITDALLALGGPTFDVEGIERELALLEPTAVAAVKQQRIAVVDDSALARAILVEHLGKVGYDVAAFADSEDAVEELLRSPPDLVVTDWDMPGLDGAEVCRRLKAQHPSLPVLILTGQQTDSALTGLQAGAEDYVRKDKTVDELSARIAALLRRATAAARLREVFARYTSDAVVAHALAGTSRALAGERREVTVLFVDVRNFTAFAESHPPETVVAALNDVLGRLADAVLTREGTVDKFLGDGLMAVFGAPNDLEDHPRRALAAAMSMLHAVEVRNRDCPPDLVLEIGVAINTGSVIAGSIGNERRTEYTCIGDAVNVASRLCSLAAPGDVIVGGSTVARFADRDAFEVLPDVMVKGKQQPIPVFRARR